MSTVAEPAVAEPLVSEPADQIARIPEAAVQDAWVRGLFSPHQLRTTAGEPVRILDRGTLNTDSGPDVTGARIYVGDVLWAGDVEIHTASGDWERHGHHTDPAYDRVVLHVVLSPDRTTGTLRRPDGSALPEVVLLPHLDRSLRSLLRAFYLEPRQAPHCAPRWSEVSLQVRRDWVQHLGTERLRQRANALGHAYTRRPDLDRLLVARAFRALGYAANADAFEALADRIDVARLRQRPGDEIHATLLATSGLADGDLFKDDGAPVERPMRREAWKRGGRPANAPTRRLAQAAAWLAPGGPLRRDGVGALADALLEGVPQAIESLRPRPAAGGRLGIPRATRVLVDAVLPILLVDAEQRLDLRLEAAVLDAYRSLPAADDAVVRQFAAAELAPASALEAQGLHQLKGAYCDDGRCARCAIGQALYPALAQT